MNYFGWIVEDLQDIWTDVHQSPYSEEAKALLKLIDKAIFAAASLERAQATAAGRPIMDGPIAKPAKVVVMTPAVRAIASAARFAAE